MLYALCDGLTVIRVPCYNADTIVSPDFGIYSKGGLVLSDTIMGLLCLVCLAGFVRLKRWANG